MADDAGMNWQPISDYPCADYDSGPSALLAWRDALGWRYRWGYGARWYEGDDGAFATRFVYDRDAYDCEPTHFWIPKPPESPHD